jgi:hypothetical protein
MCRSWPAACPWHLSLSLPAVQPPHFYSTCRRLHRLLHEKPAVSHQCIHPIGQRPRNVSSPDSGRNSGQIITSRCITAHVHPPRYSRDFSILCPLPAVEKDAQRRQPRTMAFDSHLRLTCRATPHLRAGGKYSGQSRCLMPLRFPYFCSYDRD